MGEEGGEGEEVIGGGEGVGAVSKLLLLFKILPIGGVSCDVWI